MSADAGLPAVIAAAALVVSLVVLGAMAAAVASRWEAVVLSAAAGGSAPASATAARPALAGSALTSWLAGAAALTAALLAGLELARLDAKSGLARRRAEVDRTALSRVELGGLLGGGMALQGGYALIDWAGPAPAWAGVALLAATLHALLCLGAHVAVAIQRLARWATARAGRPRG